MILIVKDKYSCLECIRGHRSSKCRHFKRPLLQVRSKGRPNVHANGDPNLRIAVFAEEIEGSDDSESGKGSEGPVVILKTSLKHVMDLEKGMVIGKYVESNTTQSDRPPPPVVNSKSFVVMSGCCSGKFQKGKQNSKECGCASNQKKNVDKARILKSFINRKINQNQKWKFVNSENNIIKLSDAEMKSEKNDELLSEVNENLNYTDAQLPPCSISGSCCCDHTCRCEGCPIHNGGSLDVLKLARELYTETPADLLTKNFKLEQGNLPGTSSETASKAEYFAPFSFPSIFDSQIPSESYHYKEPVPVSVPNPTSSQPDPLKCACLPGECTCLNCEAHGIIEGFDLDNLFPTFDPKAMNYILSISDERPIS